MTLIPTQKDIEYGKIMQSEREFSKYQFELLCDCKDAIIVLRTMLKTINQDMGVDAADSILEKLKHYKR